MTRIVTIIPARGGSKGFPGKNIAPLCGLPLISHSIQHSLNSKYVNQTYVSTDSAEIKAVSKSAGAQVIMRPAALASDAASSEDALIHAVEQIKASLGSPPELIVFLQCTSPIRAAGDIDNAVELLLSSGADSLLSAAENHRFIWEKADNTAKAINYNYNDRQRRQDLTPQYCENGSIYIFRPEALLKHRNRLSGKIAIYEMAEESSYEIDTNVDFIVVEALMKNSAKHL